MTKTWTVLEIIDRGRQYLAEKGLENARLETELLLGHTLSLPRIDLYLNFDRALREEELARFKSLLRKRLAGEPVQYVIGTAAFMFAEFEVNPAVLIPRPETEAVTEAALRVIGEIVGDRSGGRDILVADIGTGSGVIAVTLAQKVPRARVYATDSSGAALAVAEKNARRAGVADRIVFSHGTFFAPLEEKELAGRLSAIVSNPPYVPSGEIAALPAEVRDFEPREALDGGPDGLDSLRVIAQDGPRFLTAGGAMILEVGDGQAADVAGMLRRSVGSAEILKDYAGRERIVVGRNAPQDG
jgi:release factor glutamine methyltransferase